MENSRLLLAIALSFLVFFLWNIAFGPKPAPKGETPKQQSAQQNPPNSSTPNAVLPSTQPTPAEPQPVAEAASIPANEPTGRKISVETPLYRMTLSERGAAVTSMVLKKYRETVQPDSPFKELIPIEMSGGTALLSLPDLKDENLPLSLFAVDQSADHLMVDRSPETVTFSYTTKENLRIIKAYRFSADSYLVDLTVTVRNNGDRNVNSAIVLALRDLASAKASTYGFQGPSGLINNRLDQVKLKKIDEQSKVTGDIRWIAIERLYFMDCLISKSPLAGAMEPGYHNQIIQNSLFIPNMEFAPGEERVVALSLFMGPKSISVLKAADNELARAIDFGWVDIIAKPCLYFMNFIYRYIPNYGVAIIILTIISRLLFWPLAHKSYKSMNAMRKLQPLMQELKEKYKDDKVKLNQETMALYRTYKVNPLGGCLPMLIQLPVFFALYRMLYQAIELRHAPFFGWINDLSAPDRLFHFHPDFHVPLMQPPYGIPVLTLIMGATMLLQQKMSPAPGDPTQAKMMMLMPVVFTFIFINFPSGLVLYWLFSNLVSIAQQYYTQRKLA